MPFATINGIKLFYISEGQGEPVLFISGFSANNRSWMYQIPDFRRYFNVVAFDNRGSTGQTDKPAGQYSIKVMADDAIILMDHLGIRKAHIIGHSMGGCIAQEIAINNPGRVLTLVLASSWAGDGQLDTRFSTELKAAYELPAPEMVERVTKSGA